MTKLVTAAVIVFGGMFPVAGQTGSISEFVIDQAGSPVGGAVVLYRNAQQIKRDASGRQVFTSQAIRSSVTTGADGSFSINNLPVDTYYLCGYGTQPSHLGSCEWTQGSLIADLARASTVANMRLIVGNGTLLTLRFEDPNNRIRDQADSKTTDGPMALTGGNFRIGILAGSHYSQARLVNTSLGLREYQIAIPKAMTFHLFLDTSLQVSDSLGARVAAGVPAAAAAANGLDQLLIVHKIL